MDGEREDRHRGAETAEQGSSCHTGQPTFLNLTLRRLQGVRWIRRDDTMTAIYDSDHVQVKESELRSTPKPPDRSKQARRAERASKSRAKS